MIAFEPEVDLGDLETGGIRSCSSSSTSSFDSCSDLVGTMDTSAHALAQAKESEWVDTTVFEPFPPGKQGYLGSADAKHLTAPRNGYGSFVLEKNGGLVERSIKQAGSLQGKEFDGEEANLSVEPHIVQQQAMEPIGEEANLRVEPHIVQQQAMEPITANIQKVVGNIAVEKGAQITSSSPLGFDLASSSLDLSKEDTIKQEASSYPIDLLSAELKGSDAAQQQNSVGSEHDIDDRTDKDHFHLDAIAKPAADSIGIKTINSEAFPFENENQTHTHSSNLGVEVTSGPDADYDLQQLENSIKFFDLYKTNASVLHRLGSISSWRSSPDLKVFEQFDSLEANSKKQTHVRSLSTGMIRKDQKFSLSRLQGKKDEFQYEAQKKRSNLVNYNNQCRKAEPDDSLVEPEEAKVPQTLNTEQRGGQPMMNEELLGEIQQNKIWKVSSSGRISQDLATSECNNLGPDELFRYLESPDVNEKYVDGLMDTRNSLLKVESKARSLHAVNHSNMAISHRTFSDNTLSSSSSGLQIHSSHNNLSAKDIPFVVDSVEVIGARQRRGGSSLWDRMVGVKDHTVYIIKVVSGKHEWEVLRRYRDFKNFYQQLKRIFNGQSGSSLLSPLEEVESDSKQIFGNTSPNVVQARTFRIGKFLVSLLQAGPPFSTASPVFWFLRPPQGAFECTGFEEHLLVQTSALQRSVDVQLGNLDSPQLHLPPNNEGGKREQMEDRCPVTIGKTIKLVSIIHQSKSLKQVLNAQHHSCAGCYKHLDYEIGLIQGFAQAFGRRRPRFCEYTGQLYCSSCHLNEFSVLPAYVLWHWDFTPRRVSQLPKAYLDSIYDQPLLCVRTINPYLYQRVHCLRNVKETRVKLSRVVSCMRCPSHARILQIMGSRRYLLENNDFFALRDLEDLSKGAFAVLPGLLTAILKTLVLHVTKHCSVCQDSGEWCGAGILCEDPFRPIFPFNEEDTVANCKTCNAPFHRKCFAKCSSCPSCPQDWVDTKQSSASQKDERS